tara:strand:+ start:185 stop:922 length:738 start_codon:yes stop_codon:yes gene_type:complete
MIRLALIALLLGVAMNGCAPDASVGDPSEPNAPSTTDPTTPEPNDQPPEDLVPSQPDAVPVGVHGVGESDLIPAPAEQAHIRPRKRMTVDQLDLALRTATNGIGWDKSGQSELERLAETLGRPDYRQVVQEDLTPSAVFLKFLDDGARVVCSELVERELTEPIEKRILMSKVSFDDTMDSQPEKIEANLQALLLRFHGIDAPAGSAQLETWRWLHKSVVHITKDPVKAWRAVCVALINHPNFYSF